MDFSENTKEYSQKGKTQMLYQKKFLISFPQMRNLNIYT